MSMALADQLINEANSYRPEIARTLGAMRDPSTPLSARLHAFANYVLAQTASSAYTGAGLGATSLSTSFPAGIVTIPAGAVLGAGVGFTYGVSRGGATCVAASLGWTRSESSHGNESAVEREIGQGEPSIDELRSQRKDRWAARTRGPWDRAPDRGRDI